jgi:hypothetical protein
MECWTDMTEDSVSCKPKPSPLKSYDTTNDDEFYSLGVYVNLLQNPESFTGYAGPSAAKVWQSIQHENCFGGVDDTCVEKRVFYR